MNDIHETQDAARLSEVSYANLQPQSPEEQEILTIQQVGDRSVLLNLLRTKMTLPLEQIKKEEIDAIKHQFYKLRKQEYQQLEADSQLVPEEDPLEEQLRSLLLLYKEHRQQVLVEQEKQLAVNLEKKQEVLYQMKAIVEDTEHINKNYDAFQKLSAEFKEKLEVPASKREELWKDFNFYTEHFYDQMKIEKELRDYDFQKNLEHKEALCREAEMLTQEEEVVSAFRRLQELHEDWRQTGPVSKAQREEIWTRFKNASSIINKKHQAFYEEKKQRELENEKKKEDLCESLELIDYSLLRQRAQWETKTEFVIAQQVEWKKLGFASKKMNVVLFERFRRACDDFFAKKSDFFKGLKNTYSENLARKEELCELAEKNKDRTDWKKATDFYVSIQQDWKNVGPVPHRFSDAIWDRFKRACDHFFEQKTKNVSGTRSVEQQNLAQKQEIIAALKALTAQPKDGSVSDQMNELMAQWKQVGHVPFKEKDRLYQEYQGLLDQLFVRRNKQGHSQQMHNLEADLEKALGDDQAARRVYKEKERMMRQYDQLKNSLKTYENNMGFLSSHSKGGNALVKELERKLESIKDQMATIKEKIKMIDTKMRG